jgi:hypothetical protein
VVVGWLVVVVVVVVVVAAAVVVVVCVVDSMGGWSSIGEKNLLLLFELRCGRRQIECGE